MYAVLTEVLSLNAGCLLLYHSCKHGISSGLRPARSSALTQQKYFCDCHVAIKATLSFSRPLNLSCQAHIHLRMNAGTSYPTAYEQQPLTKLPDLQQSSMTKSVLSRAAVYQGWFPPFLQFSRKSRIRVLVFPKSQTVPAGVGRKL